MSATNRSSLAYVAEVTKGTTPASPTFKGLRHTSDSFAQTPTHVTSNEIRSDRQVTDQIMTDLATAGSVGIELSFAAYDDFLEAALQGTWSNNPVIIVATLDTEISDVATSIVTVASGGAAFKTGMLVALSGFTTPANNKLATVVSSTATTVTFAAATFAAEAAPIPVGATMRVVGMQGAAGDIVATANGLTSTTIDFTTLGLSLGEWVKFGGDVAAGQFATAVNNSWARVSTVAAHAVTFDVLPAGWTTDAGTGKTIQIFSGDFLTNGVTQRGFTFERQQQDITTPTYELFRGCEIDTLSLALKSAAIITGSVGVIGLAGTVATARSAGATDVAAPTYPVLNAAANVGRLMEGGAIVANSPIESLNIDLKNNLARETGVGTLGSINTRNGEIGLTGALSAYFNDPNLLNKVLGDTPTSLMTRTGRSDGNRESLVFDIPQAKLTGTSPVSGKNASRMFTGSYQAYRHPVLGYTLAIGRFSYLPVAVS
jgi:hypothetical protein